MRQARPSNSKAFTIIEVIVSIGIVMILIGLTLGALRGVREQAELTRDLALVRGNHLATVTYCGDHQELFPVHHDLAGRSALMYDRELQKGGYIKELSDADPIGHERHLMNRFAMSTTLCFPAEKMVPGATEPLTLARSTGVRHSQVSFPELKGSFVQYVHVHGGVHTGWTWNPHDRPVSPVAMVDGSAMGARCTDFRLKYDFFEHGWAGHPVLGTWDGYKGTDRLK